MMEVVLFLRQDVLSVLKYALTYALVRIYLFVVIAKII